MERWTVNSTFSTQIFSVLDKPILIGFSLAGDVYCLPVGKFVIN